MGEEPKPDNKVKITEETQQVEEKSVEAVGEEKKQEEVAQADASGSAQVPVQVVVKEKSHGGMIALIVTLAVFLGIVGTLLILQFTGVVQLQNLFNGSGIFGDGKTIGKNNYGGIGAGLYGGTIDNSAVPTVESAKKYCESHGNIWLELEDIDELASDDDFLSRVTGAYWCNTTDTDYYDEIPDGMFEFEIVFTDKSFNEIEYYAEMIRKNAENLPSDGVVLENSDEFVKMYITAYSGGYHYIAAYKNAAIELLADSTDTADQVLAGIGFPDRSYSDPASYVEQSSATKNEAPQDLNAKNDIKKVAAALKEFYADYGRYPEYTSMFSNTCTNIHGEEIACGIGILMPYQENYVTDSEAEDFFRDYVGELSHLRNSTSPASLNFYAEVDAITDEYRYNHDQSIIEIFFDAKCESETKIVKNDGGFAVTVPKYEGQVYFCAD